MKQASFHLQTNIPLTLYNTFKLPTIAHLFVDIQTIDELEALYQDPIWQVEPKLFLGSGSNILLTEPIFPGLVVKVSLSTISCVQEDDQHAWIKAGAGENWHALVTHCISKGYAGIENLSYIPGTAGAAPIQNIGAYGVELKDVLEELEAFDVSSGQRVIFKNHDCGFGYRHSIFKEALKNQYVICSITLKLNKNPSFNTQYGEIQQTLFELGLTELTLPILGQVITHIRQKKLPNPVELPNVGSFFKNPLISTNHFNQLKQHYPELPHYPMPDHQYKIPAGWLIEKIGWKGKQQGYVGTYEKQALVIVNHAGKATGKEVLAFAQNIQQSVKTTFGIELLPEVTLIS